MMGFDKDKAFGPKNFKYIDDLIQSGAKEIVLDLDIVLGDVRNHNTWKESNWMLTIWLLMVMVTQ